MVRMPTKEFEAAAARAAARRHEKVVAREFARQLRLAYPAHPDDALASLTGTAPWPGPAMVWVELNGKRSRLVPGR